MKCHMITVRNGNIEGLTQEEAKTLFNCASKDSQVQSVIGNVAEKVQESISVDAHLLNKLVESGEISKSDAYDLMHEYYELSRSLKKLDEGFIDDAKKFGSDTYLKAGLAVGKAQAAVGKAIGNILNWMKAHPKLTVGLTVVALLLIIPTQAFASSQVDIQSSLFGEQHFYCTSGTDLNALKDIWTGGENKTASDIAKAALKFIGDDSVVVLPGGEHFTGKAIDIIKKLDEFSGKSLDNIVLLSKQAIPHTGDGNYTYEISKGVVTGATPLPWLK